MTGRIRRNKDPKREKRTDGNGKTPEMKNGRKAEQKKNLKEKQKKQASRQECFPWKKSLKRKADERPENRYGPDKKRPFSRS